MGRHAQARRRGGCRTGPTGLGPVCADLLAYTEEVGGTLNASWTNTQDPALACNLELWYGGDEPSLISTTPVAAGDTVYASGFNPTNLGQVFWRMTAVNADQVDSNLFEYDA